ncbi:MAG TPA: fructosamine kinase family protein [Burkholderiales bacterium]|jgi:fructosamine-3-kinase
MQPQHVKYCLTTLIARISRRVVEIGDLKAVAGGSIQPAFIATLADGARFFVKVGTPEQRERLRAEARGLEALRAAGGVRVPQTWLVGGEVRYYFLVLEYLDLRAGVEAAHARLGRELAQLHRATAPAFGFERDNFIGATPQPNTQSASWPLFWREQRLLPQLRLAQEEASARPWIDRGFELAERLEGFFGAYRPQPSLLHGDLWPGNAGFLADGTPVIYDPAVYYGDREAELATTEMFGGLPPAFHAAYREAWPLDTGYTARRSLYQLYHLLNHHHLFGASYASAVGAQIDALLAAIK